METAKELHVYAHGCGSWSDRAKEKLEDRENGRQRKYRCDAED